LATAALGLGGCSTQDGRASDPPADSNSGEATGDAESTARADEAVPVEVAALGRGPIEEVLRFSANLEAEQAVGVYAQAARQVTELEVEEGDRVGKGQVLVRLQDGEQRTQLAKVESQIVKAQREYDRQKRLWADQLIPEQTFNDATYELDQLRLAKEEAERQLSYTVVRSPIAGTVTHRLVGLGDTVTVNQHLFDVVDFDTLVARIYVPEKELPKLHDGLSARLTAPALDGALYRGVVRRLAPVVDPKSGTVKVTVGIPEWRGLRPGLYVDVALVTDVHPDAVLVPKRALVYDQDQVFVYRLAGAPAGGGKGAETAAGPTVERVLLESALEDKEHVEPAGSELAAGDRLVVSGQAGLKDGARVRVLDRAEEAAAPAGQVPEPEPDP
jgi:membrane fusion protein (multidrug efflux system)